MPLPSGLRTHRFLLLSWEHNPQHLPSLQTNAALTDLNVRIALHTRLYQLIDNHRSYPIGLFDPVRYNIEKALSSSKAAYGT